MLNKNYSKEIDQNIITIKNFLQTDFVNKIQEDIRKIDKTWWYVSMLPVDTTNVKENTRYYDGLFYDEKFLQQFAYNIKWFNEGNFGYVFKRNINNHYDTCVCIQCNLRKYFDSDEIKSELSKIVGEKVTELNETFCSKYENGDYLSLHHDKGNGDYAFVFQLTKDWNPSYGGLLNFYSPDTNEIYKTVNPIFNSLTIFKIKNVPNTDHFVSTNVSSHTRYAFTGWFSVASD
jgi:Rps23 Pro-64 3,4-dihydroxylase Tpa1-like proline 4-hydroxylase